MVGDYYSKKWEPNVPFHPNYIPPNSPIVPQWSGATVSKTEFDQLKKEVLEMKELLIAAKLIDEKTGQPDCEQEDKVALLKKIAEIVGVDLSEIFNK